MLEAGADPNARDKCLDNTPLHASAANNEDPAVTMALLDAGADPNARNEDGKLPFDYAQESPALKRPEAYWRLNDARFE